MSRFFVRMNPAETYTHARIHTSNLLKTIKTIGTICFIACFSLIVLQNFAYGETLTIDWLVDGDSYTQTTCSVGDDLILPQAPVKRGYTFLGWDITRYTEIEYLESTGTQYIRTSSDFRLGDEFFIDYMHTRVLSGENKGYGSGGPISGQSYNSVITGGGRQVSNIQQMWIVNSNYAYSPSVSLNNLLNIRTTERWRLDASTRRLSSTLTNLSSGATYTLTSGAVTAGYTSNGAVTLFRDNYDPWANWSAMRIYRVWLKRSNGTYAFDLIPVKDLNGIPCMYDRVSETFLYNLGTGSFEPGPDL